MPERLRRGDIVSRGDGLKRYTVIRALKSREFEGEYRYWFRGEWAAFGPMSLEEVYDSGYVLEDK